MSAIISRIMDEEAVQRAVKRIAHEILEKQTNIENIRLIGVYRRGVPLAERIAQEVFTISGVKMPVGRVDVTPFRDDMSYDILRSTSARSSFPSSIAGRCVIIVDDVLFTGRTARAAIDAVLTRGRPDNIQLAVLVDRGHRELPIRADYVGKNVPTAQNERIVVRIPPYDDETNVILKAQQVS